jgi:hypothetical protein
MYWFFRTLHELELIQNDIKQTIYLHTLSEKVKHWWWWLFKWCFSGIWAILRIIIGFFISHKCLLASGNCTFQCFLSDIVTHCHTLSQWSHLKCFIFWCTLLTCILRLIFCPNILLHRVHSKDINLLWTFWCLDKSGFEVKTLSHLNVTLYHMF